MDGPYRIAMLSVHTCPVAVLGGKKTGGMNVYVRDLTRELSRRGVAVDVFTRAHDPALPHINDADLGRHARVIHVPAGPKSPLGSDKIYSHLAQFVAGVLDFVDHEGVSYDVIHSHYWLSGWVARELRREWHVPVVQMFHTLGHMKNRVAQRADERVSDVRIRVETEVVHFADLLVAATPAERIQLMWLYDAPMRKIRVVPPGVDLERFRPLPPHQVRQQIGMPAHHKMLLFVGRIEPLKGIDTLLRAIAILRDRAPEQSDDLCLCIVGGNPSDNPEHEDQETQRLKALRQDLGLGDLVTFLGAKDQDALQYYYGAAEMLIMPSYYESFGMVALEAMACGTPVIASEVGGLAYLIQDGVTGFHVPDHEPDELAGKVGLILQNPALRSEMSAAAVERAQAYGWPIIADRLGEVYREAVQAWRAT
jgi:D-inositol-3-phosphate glycosyltransferase